MKIEIIRDDIEVAPGVEFDAGIMTRRDGRAYLKRGAICETDKRSAFIHVGNADAVPHDEEAKVACARQMQGWDYKLRAREALAKGIHPEDMAGFMDGVIAGYDECGDTIPGPNAEPEE